MIKAQPTLINYSNFLGFYNLTLQTNQDIFLSKNNVIHTKRKECPKCGKLCSYNGSNYSGNIISRSYSTLFKKGQQKCSNCNTTVQPENPIIDKIKLKLNNMIISMVLSLREKYLSYQEIASHLNDCFKIKISKSTIEKIIESELEKIYDLELDFDIEDYFYGYDEQYLKVNGKRVYRIVIFDYKNNIPIYEADHPTLTRKILIQILKSVFKKTKPKGFVFDMRTMYPDAFKEVFGKKIKLQFCIFHLNKHILDGYRKALKITNSTVWTITDYYNMYTIFDTFYDRKNELDLLASFDKEFRLFKYSLKYAEDYSVFFENIKFPKKCKSETDKIDFLILIYEKSLMKKFRKYLHQERLKRKRNKVNLTTRQIGEAENKLKSLLYSIDIFPKKIQKIINNIKNNFDIFTGSNGEINTNNKLEGFFGVTLKKFRKKGFQTDKGLKNFFAFQKMKYLKQKIAEPISLISISTIFSIFSLFFT